MWDTTMAMASGSHGRDEELAARIVGEDYRAAPGEPTRRSQRGGSVRVVSLDVVEVVVVEVVERLRHVALLLGALDLLVEGLQHRALHAVAGLLIDRVRDVRVETRAAA